MSHQSQTRQTTPPYSEEQVTRWLAFLARNLNRHDQTIFLLEAIQPSWLLMREQRRTYHVASRVIWGLFCGLIYGLLLVLIVGLIGRSAFDLIFHLEWLRVWQNAVLLFGLVVGLINGLIETKRSYHNTTLNWTEERRFQIQKGFIVYAGLSNALILGMIDGFLGEFGGLIGGLMGLLIGILIFWPIYSPIFELRGYARILTNEIETIETVRFRWDTFPAGFWNGLQFGLSNPLIWFPLGIIIPAGLYSFSKEGYLFLILALIIGLTYGAIVGLFGGLLNCFQPSVQELKTIPNQGIWLSLRTGGQMGGIGGLALGVIVGLIGGWMNGLVYGSLGGLCIVLWYGGLDVIQHFLVRFLLWRAGSLPWRLAPFLDYAAEELHFLQKVGGGYIFVHRYLLEHFAAMETGGRQTTDRRKRTAGQ